MGSLDMDESDQSEGFTMAYTNERPAVRPEHNFSKFKLRLETELYI